MKSALPFRRQMARGLATGFHSAAPAARREPVPGHGPADAIAAKRPEHVLDSINR